MLAPMLLCADQHGWQRPSYETEINNCELKKEKKNIWPSKKKKDDEDCSFAYKYLFDPKASTS